ncbi:DUF6338 family protein [Halorientalis brevis]|uniref:DUF6338 family protein n=1 Tax=Halorientalis brevis TaxID=1126241 RepID=A0ABD6CDQ6_9EURY|nr:DUF6338 family protein [Halorientalis brevis]
MASPTSVPVSLLVILLLLAPGLVGLQLLFRFGQRNPSPSRTQWITWSTFVSLLSLSILYFTSGLYLTHTNELATTLVDRLGLVDINTLTGLGLADIVILYMTHLMLTLGGGVAMGKLYDSWNDDPLDRREPWHYAFDEGTFDGESLDVYLEDGTILRGEFIKKAWDADQRDLYLEEPYEVVEEADGEDESDLGRSLLIQDSAISHVVFTKEDPDSERTEAVDVSDETMEQMENQLRDILNENIDEFENEDTTDQSKDEGIDGE